MGRILSHDQAAAFYDRLGKALDTQSFYEDPAIEDMVEHGQFGNAGCVVDFGCGTGRLAERLLDRHLPRTARLLALDVSTRMVELTKRRLERFGKRPRVEKTAGDIVLPLADGAADRVIATYVVDLLSKEDSHRFLDEARRVLAPGGLVCLVSLTEGQGPVSRALCGVWKFIHRLNPAFTGGCRPIRLLPLLGPEWTPRHHRVIVSFGVPSEILVAEKTG